MERCGPAGSRFPATGWNARQACSGIARSGSTPAGACGARHLPAGPYGACRASPPTRPTSSSICREASPGSAGAIFTECPDHGVGLPVDNGEQHPRCPVGNTRALLPLLKRPHIQAETPGKLPTAQTQPFAERDNPAWQHRLSANMAKSFPMYRPIGELSGLVGAWRTEPLAASAVCIETGLQ